jgi:hypothetical protein
VSVLVVSVDARRPPIQRSFAARQIPLHPPDVRFAQALWLQDRERLADDLLRRVAENLLHRRVRKLDAARLVHQDHCVVRCLPQDPEPALALYRAVPGPRALDRQRRQRHRRINDPRLPFVRQPRLARIQRHRRQHVAPSREYGRRPRRAQLQRGHQRAMVSLRMGRSPRRATAPAPADTLRLRTMWRPGRSPARLSPR